MKEYSVEQERLMIELEEHSKGNQSFYITANKVLNLASRAWEIFESSKAKEKTQLLGFLLQNLTLTGETLSFQLNSPFDAIYGCRDKEWLPLRDIFRTLDWGKIRREVEFI